MGKTARFEHWRWTTSGRVELAIAAIGVCLQDPGPAIEMGLRVLSAPVARIVEQRRRRIGTAEWPVVADIDPQPAGVGLALGKDWHCRVVAVQSFGGKNMGLDLAIEGHERESG